MVWGGLICSGGVVLDIGLGVGVGVRWGVDDGGLLGRGGWRFLLFLGIFGVFWVGGVFLGGRGFVDWGFLRGVWGGFFGGGFFRLWCLGAYWGRWFLGGGAGPPVGLGWFGFGVGSGGGSAGGGGWGCRRGGVFFFFFFFVFGLGWGARFFGGCFPSVGLFVFFFFFLVFGAWGWSGFFWGFFFFFFGGFFGLVFGEGRNSVPLLISNFSAKSLPIFPPASPYLFVP